jgi:hypothetical protein
LATTAALLLVTHMKQPAGPPMALGNMREPAESLRAIPD